MPKINFFSDLERQLKIELRRLGCHISSGASLDDLLYSWLDYEIRTIPAHPRDVRKSAQFRLDEQNLTSERLRALKSIVAKLKSGQDVTAHLSKGLLKAEAPDLLLADWRIHHIHISDTKKKPTDFFFDRADKLVFALITPEVAYLIRIFHHKQKNVWADKSLLETIRDNWPELLKPVSFRGKLVPAVSITEEDRVNLRKSGVYVPTELGDTLIFSLGGGVNSAGRPISHSTKANSITNTISIITEYLTGYPEILEELKSELGTQELALELIWSGGRMSIQEQNTKKYLSFDMKIVNKAVAELIRREQLSAGQ
jgi:hypothetical protein